MLPAPRSNRSLQNPVFLQLLSADKMLHHRVLDMPCFMSSMSEPQEEFRFASHPVIGAAWTDGGVKAYARSEDASANGHVRPENQPRRYRSFLQCWICNRIGRPWIYPLDP